MKHSERHTGNTRTCTKCGEVKPLDQFTLNKRSADGREHRCRSCTNKHNRALEARQPDKQLRRDAYNALAAARRDPGFIVPETCQFCRLPRPLVAHHWNGYDHPLDVWWLCPSCHTRLHRGSLPTACIHESQKGVAAIPPAAHPAQDTPQAVCILPSPVPSVETVY